MHIRLEVALVLIGVLVAEGAAAVRTPAAHLARVGVAVLEHDALAVRPPLHQLALVRRTALVVVDSLGGVRARAR